MRTTLLILILVMLPGGITSPDEMSAPPLIEELGLPTSTDGGTEIRVWVVGGIYYPSRLLRVYETDQGVSGEKIVWASITREGQFHSEKDAAKLNARKRRVISKHHCAPQQTANYLWCRRDEKREFWNVLLDDLIPEQLWKLPATLERECGVMMEDGETVRIEIIQGDRYHTVAYSNPGFCCPHLECAVVNHARQLLQAAMDVN